MELNWIHVEGTQEDAPLAFDATISKTIAYVRKNIEQVTKYNDDGSTYEIWEYDEAQILMDDFNAIASAIVSEQGVGINDNSDGIFDVAELSDENSQGVFDLAEMYSELEERVTALEGK